MLASHGKWCSAVTWPTKCPSCGEPVFFFRCNCGCKVFFDDLGSPWPIHDCDTSWTKNVIRTRDADGGVTVQLSEGVSITRAPEGFSVDTYTVSAGIRRHKNTAPDPIVAVVPDGKVEAITVVGILREKEAKVNVERALRLDERTSMSAAFLGPLAAGNWGKVTVHEPSASGNVLHSYTIFVPTPDIRNPQNDKGVTVLVDVQVLNVPSVAHVWYSTHYEVLG